MYDTYNNENKKRKKLTIIAIILGVAALLSVVFLIISIVSKDKQEPAQETYSLKEVQAAANRYAHYIIDGDKNDKSEITEALEEGKSSALEKILNEDEGKSDRKAFIKTEKKLNKDLRNKIKNVEQGKIKKAQDYISMIEDVGVEIDMINKFYDTDFEIEKYLTAYQKKGEDGVVDAVVSKYKDDVYLYYDLVQVEAENPKDGEEYIEYSEIATDTEKIMADFYKFLIDYGVSIADTFDLYKAKDCLSSAAIRATCRSIIDESEIGLRLTEDRETAMKIMIKKIEEAKADAIFVVQDVTQKLNK